MAFISEIHWRTSDVPDIGNEFVEITLGPNDNPADFVLSFYTNTGALHTTIEATGIVNGEVNLSNVSGVADPQNPGYTVYTIASTAPSGELINGTRSLVSDEANHIALTNTSTGTVLDAYSVHRNVPTTLNGGAADGATTTNIGRSGNDQTIQFDNLGNRTTGAPTPNDAEIVCFARSTRISTPEGEVPVEALKAGDQVLDTDGVAHPIRWIGSQHVSKTAIQANPKLRPVRISASALGPCLPKADLLVTRQHRILVRSKIAARMFGSSEVLIAAIKLTALPGIFVDPESEATDYFHILLDKHEVILAEGAAAESLYPGPHTLDVLSPCALEELETLFPELLTGDQMPQTSRRVPDGQKQRRLIERHAKNNKVLFQTH